jgi:flavin-dependent dehydrogenase
LDGITKSSCHKVDFTVDLRDRFRKEANGSIVRCVIRSEFDTHLLRNAELAGAKVFQGVRVGRIQSGRGRRDLDTSIGPFRAKYVLGADGANSVVGRLLNERQSFFWQTALFAEIPARSLDLSGMDPCALRIDWGTLPSGYAWLFPKGETVNVGAGGPNRLARLLKNYLVAFLRREKIAGQEVLGSITWKGHQLPTMTRRTRFASDGILLLGDAAGMVEPLTGEGISYACQSAKLAADVILDQFDGPDLEASYTQLVHSEIRSEIAWSLRILHFAALFPRTFCASFRNSQSIWNSFCRVLRGERTFQSLQAELLGPLHILSASLAPFARIRDIVGTATGDIRRLEQSLKNLRERDVQYAG